MSEKALEVSANMVVAWIATRTRTTPEPREVAEAFLTVHKAVVAAGSSS